MAEFIKQYGTRAALISKWRRMEQGAKMRGKYIEYKFSTWTKDLNNLVIRGYSNYWVRSSLEEMFAKNFKTTKK